MKVIEERRLAQQKAEKERKELEQQRLMELKRQKEKDEQKLREKREEQTRFELKKSVQLERQLQYDQIIRGMHDELVKWYLKRTKRIITDRISFNLATRRFLQQVNNSKKVINLFIQYKQILQ